jgi:O-antigen/teichoic acid export membrane protein
VPDGPTAPHDRAHHGNDLTRKTAGGATSLISARLASKAIDFVVLLILARLLAPTDFGIIAIAMTAISIIEAVFELPLYQVLVSLDVIERRHLDTAFTLGAMRGLAMAVILSAAAWPLAHFYHDPRLAGLILVLSVAPGLRGLGSPRLVTFAKRMDFRRELACEVICKLVSLMLAVTAAFTLRDYRALAAGVLATPAAWVVATYVLAPYRPRFSLATWPLFASFVGWTSAAQFLSALNWQCDRLILGRTVTRPELGAYSLANDLSFIPEQALIKPVMRPLLSAFALIRDDRERLALAYLTAANAILAMGTPLLLTLSLLAGPTVRFALGETWIPAIPILQWLSLTLIPPLFTAPYGSLALATGRAQGVLKQTAAEAVTKLPLMFVGATLLGINGAIAARGVSAVATALLVVYLTRLLIGTSVVRQLAGTWRTIVASLVLAATLLVLRPLLNDVSGLVLGLRLALVAGAGFGSYAASLALLWHLSGRPGGFEHAAFVRIINPLLGRFVPVPG